MLKKLPALFAGLLLTLVVYAVGDDDLRAGHPDTYTVKRGDTLWDISARFLKKPWLWPEIWQANPQIENPHLIYPGDVLNLAYLNGKYRVTQDSSNGPRVRTQSLENAIEPIPLKDIKEFLKNMRIVDEATFKRLPHIVGVEESRLRVAEGNLVYVKGLGDAKPGDQFVVARQTNLYWSMPPEEKGDAPTTHVRATDPYFGERGMLWHHAPMEHTFKGDVKLLGYEVMVIGSVTVTRATNPASLLVTYSDVEVRPGDLILPVEDKPYDSHYLPHAPAQVPPDFKVLAFTDANYAVGPRQVVALSRGAADGVENGQTYSIYTPGEKVTDNYKYPEGSMKKFFNPKDSKVTLPEEYIGHVMIFRTFDRVSYGLIMDGVRPTRLGDNLRAPD